MANWKISPKEKIYEAFSVLADHRIEVLSQGKATLTSSTGNKKYNIEWIEGNPLKITSNDNASYWQGYAGYPIIAILMYLEKISYNKTIVDLFKGINWNELNKKCGHNYAKVVENILSEFNHTQVHQIVETVDSIYKQLSETLLEKINKREKPPKDTI